MTVTLSAEMENYGGSGKAWIAKVTGLIGQRMSYDFCGERSSIGSGGRYTVKHEAVNTGLYVVHSTNRKGDGERSYHVVLEDDDEMFSFRVQKDVAMKVAKGLNDGRTIEDMIDSYTGEFRSKAKDHSLNQDDKVKRLITVCREVHKLVDAVVDDIESHQQKEAITESLRHMSTLCDDIDPNHHYEYKMK